MIAATKKASPEHLAYIRAWQLANPDKRKAACAKYNHSLKAKIADKRYNMSKKNKISQRKHDLKKKYGLSLEEYFSMIDQQGGICAVCSGPPVGHGHLVVDHDHKTGTVRKLLCDKCNLGLGYFNDNPELMEKAAAYVRNHA